MRKLLIAILLAGCPSSGDHEEYPSYQECFDDHHTHEAYPVQESIVICCLEHPIAGMHQPVCGSTAAECEAYLTTNLSATSASGTDRMVACTDYITQKGM